MCKTFGTTKSRRHVVFAMTRNYKLALFFEGVVFGTDFLDNDTFVPPDRPQARKFIESVWPAKTDDEYALLIPGTMSVTDPDKTTLVLVISP